MVLLIPRGQCRRAKPAGTTRLRGSAVVSGPAVAFVIALSCPGAGCGAAPASPETAERTSEAGGAPAAGTGGNFPRPRADGAAGTGGRGGAQAQGTGGTPPPASDGGTKDAASGPTPDAPEAAELDAAAEGRARPPAGTHENSLRIRFVPLPGTALLVPILD